MRLRTEDGLALKEIAKRLGVKNPVSSQYWVTRFKRGGIGPFSQAQLGITTETRVRIPQTLAGFVHYT